MKKIIFIQGSLRKDSNTNTLLEYVMQSFEKEQFAVRKIDLRDYDLPFCDGRPLQDYPEIVETICAEIRAADAVVIGMPVYCYSVSGPLKNFIDLTSSAFTGKRFGIVSAAGSQLSYLAAADLIKILGYEVKGIAIQPTVFASAADFDGEFIVNDRVKEKAHELVEIFKTIGRTGQH